MEVVLRMIASSSTSRIFLPVAATGRADGFGLWVVELLKTPASRERWGFDLPKRTVVEFICVAYSLALDRDLVCIQVGHVADGGNPANPLSEARGFTCRGPGVSRGEKAESFADATGRAVKLSCNESRPAVC